jgi:hypothetical protein
MIRKLLFSFCCVLTIFLTNVVVIYAATDPIAHWKFDAGSGTTAGDSSGNSITGSFLTPNPTWTSNVPDVEFTNPYSLDFTGNGDGVSISWPSGMNFADTDPRSFSFWYKPTANGEAGGTMARIISWSNDRFEIAGTDGSSSTHRIAFYDGNWHSTDINLSLGTWYFVIFTYDGTTARFYIGNELQEEHSLAGRALSGTMMIGNRVQNPNEGINGQIDDVRVYDYALNSTQVSNLAAGSDDPDVDPNSPTPTPTPTSIPSSGGGSSSSTSSPSTSTCATRPSGVPDLFQINTTGSTATLFFPPVGNTSNYQISYGFTQESNQFRVKANQGSSTGALSYTVNSLPRNSTLYFKVYAQNNCGQGNWSNVMEVKTNGRKYFKNLISQIASVFPKQTTVLGATKQRKVLGNRTDCMMYTVKSGDSLWSIALEKLGSGVEHSTIVTSNNLSSTDLRVGQKLKVGC